MVPIPKEILEKKEIEWHYKEAEIVLGKKLDNPYTIENMQKAYDNLRKKYNSSAKLNENNQVVKVSHLYIRWLPKSWAEYDELKNDRKLMLFDIPLDYEVVVNGNKYHDKTIPADLPTWQYTVIEKDYKYNKKIKYEILAEAYLPEKDKELKDKNGRFAAGFTAEELINEALTITNNPDYLIPFTSKNAKVAWRPGGYVKVYDTRLGTIIPVQGVYVRARRFLSIESGVTKADGRYDAGGTFGGGADYALYWEAADFDVRSGALGQAWVNGPHLASDWNVKFTGGVDRFYAHVFRGAWRYHYGDIDDLCRPGRMPDPRFAGAINAAIKYAAYNSLGTGAEGINYGNWTVFGTNPNIGVWRYQNDINLGVMELDSDEIFSTTIHETAHSTHIRVLNLIQFANVSKFIRESWATGIELFITTLEYSPYLSNYGNFNYSQPNLGRPLSYANQYWKKDIGDNYDYSSIFIDLVDSHNQFFSSPNIYFQYPNDPVSGFKYFQLESKIMPNTFALSSLLTNLKNNKPNNGLTDTMLESFILEYVKP